MLILFDWDGVIARRQVAEEAALRRCKTLGMNVSREWMQKAQKTHAHYRFNKEATVDKSGKPDLVVGDRDDDIYAGKKIGAKTVFTTWGAVARGRIKEHDMADFVIEKPEQLKDVTKEIK